MIYKMIVVIQILVFLDVVTTVYGLQLIGMQEQNTIFQPNITSMIGKLIVTALFSVLVMFTYEKGRKEKYITTILKLVMLIIIIFYLFVVENNVIQIYRSLVLL